MRMRGQLSSVGVGSDVQCRPSGWRGVGLEISGC